jgi:hypothetical protein
MKERVPHETETVLPPFDRTLLLLEELAGLRVPVWFVACQDNDCPGRRIY